MTTIDEQAISTALDAAGAPRHAGDAAALCAIAAQNSLDQAMLRWWIKDIHSRGDWSPAALRAWCCKHRDLLQHVAGGASLEH